MLTADEGSMLKEDVITRSLCNSGSSSISNCSERVSNAEDLKDDGDTNEDVDSVR
jgi:hypothetical protein